ncbi:MAG: serine/threonine-protein kinase [Kofleriaceae bacterium]
MRTASDLTHSVVPGTCPADADECCSARRPTPDLRCTARCRSTWWCIIESLFTAGQSIGNYRVLSMIGTGGMGVVYLAEHPLIGKRVALKVIHRELAGNREVVQRFFQEAKAVNQIGNEHIVEIHDFGATPEGDHFIIMEYLEGRTLAAILAREGRIEVMRALHVGAQIAAALGAAHDSGVLHRDLKPDNIMVMPRLGDPDFVKVLDFGLAKLFGGDGASAIKTAAGVLLGTPQYMSPEACEGKRALDPRTDVYALGILLFQMMTGALPFDGASMGEVLVKQVTALPPAPRGLNPAIPPAVEQVLLRCLAKPVDARFQSMEQLREALLDPEAYLRGSPPIAPARSVAPGEAGVDAAQVMAHAAARQQARAATTPGVGDSRSAQPTVLDGGVPVTNRTGPLPQLAPPTEPRMDTMRIATPFGYSSRPPRKVWPVVLVISLLLGLGGGAFAVAWFGRGAGGAAAGTGSTAAGSASTIAGSAAAGSVVAGSGSATVDSGSAIASSDSPGGRSTGSGGNAAGSASGSGSGNSSTVAAGSAGSNAGSAAEPSMAKLIVDSAPSGATVHGPGGQVLGKTPLSLSWPISTEPVTLELRKRGYRKKQTDIVVSENTVIRVELDALPPAAPAHPGSGSATEPKSDLIRPE